MAEPALELAPAEEVAAEETAKQTTRLVLIEGGEGTAAGTGELVTGETVGEGILAGMGPRPWQLGPFSWSSCGHRKLDRSRAWDHGPNRFPFRRPLPARSFNRARKKKTMRAKSGGTL